MEKEGPSQAVSRILKGERFPLEHLVLASASPRRAEILRAVNWSFETSPAEIDESLGDGEAPTAYVERLALAKATKVAEERLFGLVLGADTTVVSADGRILGKPRDAEDAEQMLRALRGNWHEVLTGVALVRAETKEFRVAYERTRVCFAELSDEEIAWYVTTEEPMGKAGAYAVQGRAALFIEAIEGDYWNVVGLPVRLVYRLAFGSP